MSKPIPVKWTVRSLRNANSISEYLHRKFSKKQVKEFENILKEFEKTVTFFPHLYPESEHRSNLRKAVVHKYTSIFYVYKNGEVTVVAMQDNRQEKPSD